MSSFSSPEVARPPLLPRLSAPSRLPSFPKRQPSNSQMGPLTPPLQRSRPFQFATISHVHSSTFNPDLHPSSGALNDRSPAVQDGSDGSEDDSQSFRSTHSSDSPPTSQSPNTNVTNRSSRPDSVPASPVKERGFAADLHSASSSQPPPRVQQSTTQPVFPYSRPYSVPDTLPSTGAETMRPPSPVRGTWPDRISSASFSSPMQTPYYALPKSPPESPVAQYSPTEAEPNPTANLCPSRFRSAPTSPVFSSPSASATRPVSEGDLPTGMNPPPEPPTILTPPPPPDARGRSRAPYEPFLSHAPPPEDSWIAIETAPSDYKLVIRLPGYDRDAMWVYYAFRGVSLPFIHSEPLPRGENAFCTSWLTLGRKEEACCPCCDM
jgi:hypothetical protein